MRVIFGVIMSTTYTYSPEEDSQPRRKLGTIDTSSRFEFRLLNSKPQPNYIPVADVVQHFDMAVSTTASPQAWMLSNLQGVDLTDVRGYSHHTDNMLLLTSITSMLGVYNMRMRMQDFKEYLYSKGIRPGSCRFMYIPSRAIESLESVYNADADAYCRDTNAIPTAYGGYGWFNPTLYWSLAADGAVAMADRLTKSTALLERPSLPEFVTSMFTERIHFLHTILDYAWTLGMDGEVEPTFMGERYKKSLLTDHKAVKFLNDVNSNIYNLSMYSQFATILDHSSQTITRLGTFCYLHLVCGFLPYILPPGYIRSVIYLLQDPHSVLRHASTVEYEKAIAGTYDALKNFIQEIIGVIVPGNIIHLLGLLGGTTFPDEKKAECSEQVKGVVNGIAMMASYADTCSESLRELILKKIGAIFRLPIRDYTYLNDSNYQYMAVYEKAFSTLLQEIWQIPVYLSMFGVSRNLGLHGRIPIGNSTVTQMWRSTVPESIQTALKTFYKCTLPIYTSQVTEEALARNWFGSTHDDEVRNKLSHATAGFFNSTMYAYVPPQVSAKYSIDTEVNEHLASEMTYLDICTQPGSAALMTLVESYDPGLGAYPEAPADANSGNLSMKSIATALQQSIDTHPFNSVYDAWAQFNSSAYIIEILNRFEMCKKCIEEAHDPEKESSRCEICREVASEINSKRNYQSASAIRHARALRQMQSRDVDY